MGQTFSSQLKTLGLEIRIATLSLKIEVALSELERRYRSDSRGLRVELLKVVSGLTI